MIIFVNLHDNRKMIWDPTNQPISLEKEIFKS